MMEQFFHSLPVPTIWAGISFALGVGITVVAFILVLRKYGPLQAKALEGLVKVYEKQINANEHALEMQKSHYEEELKILREERDDYKQTLHAKRDEWQVESTRMQLLIQELEGRPDLTSVSVMMEKVVELIGKVAESIDRVSNNLDKHDKSIDTRMRQFAREFKKR